MNTYTFININFVVLLIAE